MPVSRTAAIGPVSVSPLLVDWFRKADIRLCTRLRRCGSSFDEQLRTVTAAAARIRPNSEFIVKLRAELRRA